MSKITGIYIGIIFLGIIFYTSVSAQTATSTQSVQELIQSLKQQIETLQTQVVALKAQLESMQQTQTEIRTTLKLLQRLRFGMSGEDVKLLQEILATDPEIYPEGFITGHFGFLTEKAVKRFQQKAGIDSVGLVGPQTLSKINEILQEGAGNSGKVPPGLLIAPGIKKKLGFAPQPLPGQELPPGIEKKLTPATSTATSTPDITAPVISDVLATSTGATSTLIAWLTDEASDSKVWYDISTPLAISTSTPAVSVSDLVLNHELLLPDLTASTTYYYIVSSADAVDNRATSSELFFTTSF